MNRLQKYKNINTGKNLTQGPLTKLLCSFKTSCTVFISSRLLNLMMKLRTTKCKIKLHHELMASVKKMMKMRIKISMKRMDKIKNGMLKEEAYEDEHRINEEEKH